jgi:hypothetical protein
MSTVMPGGSAQLPGEDLVAAGLEDVRAGRDTPPAALVRMAAPRLRSVGIDVPAAEGALPGHRLYELLAREHRATAHRRYNALVGRMVSFARAAEHARTR